MDETRRKRRVSRRGGGRSWWADFEFTRINIKPTIPKNEFEENLDILDNLELSERY
jgi:hypothetical protein